MIKGASEKENLLWVSDISVPPLKVESDLRKKGSIVIIRSEKKSFILPISEFSYHFDFFRQPLTFNKEMRVDFFKTWTTALFHCRAAYKNVLCQSFLMQYNLDPLLGGQVSQITRYRWTWHERAHEHIALRKREQNIEREKERERHQSTWKERGEQRIPREISRWFDSDLMMRK